LRSSPGADGFSSEELIAKSASLRAQLAARNARIAELEAANAVT
jgi:hypothetical protein